MRGDNRPSRAPIAILAAMDAELEEFLRHAEAAPAEDWAGLRFHRGRLAGREVVMARSGIGKVFAAMACQRMLDAYAPSAFLFTGVAGSLDAALEIGDVVVGAECLHHDVDGRALGFPRGQLLYSPHRVFAADARLLDLALAARVDPHRIRAGRILTGDQFLSREELDRHRYLVDELGGQAVEMEGAAVAQVCALNGVPWLVVRTVSDQADGSAAADFTRFLPEAARNSFRVVRAVLEGLGPG